MRRRGAVWLAGLMTGLLAGAPGGCGGVEEDPCRAGEACTCDEIDACAYTCDGADCSFGCAGPGACGFSCPAGGCEATCAGTGRCTMDCAGGGCSMDCSGSGSCSLLECNKDCDVTCANLGSCELACQDPSCVRK